jgi:hypothetical protein
MKGIKMNCAVNNALESEEAVNTIRNGSVFKF